MNSRNGVGRRAVTPPDIVRLGNGPLAMRTRLRSAPAVLALCAPWFQGATECAAPRAPSFPSAAVATAAALPSGDAIGDAAASALEAARKLEAAGDWPALVELLGQRAKRFELVPDEERLLALGLEQVGRLDEAAHHMDLCALGWERLGHDREAKIAVAAVRRLDPLTARREPFVRKVTTTLLAAARDLLDDNDAERALRIATGLPRIARGKDASAAEEVLARARAAFEKVELTQPEDAGASPNATSERPVVEFETEHYVLACHLEPEVAQRLGKLMDDIHAFYVRVYFDGDAKRARGQKAKILIAPDKATMLLDWEGDGGPDGWWSPGSGEVHAYDTRGATGSLDAMLETLFHEASHQFMTKLAGAGSVPAWLNEGTSSFFEGTVAMADGRVLWPRAALGRLVGLCHQIGELKPPRLRDVVEYAGPGSYPPAYYTWGWGLAYFLQEYEDPKTLQHVYRPLYAGYRSEVIQKGAATYDMFERWFLGDRSPLGHRDFSTFERAWEAWILDEVAPLHGRDAKARTLRLAQIERLVAAADAAPKKKSDTSAADFLERALVHFEWIRTQIDGDEPDAELLLRQATVFERLGRKSSAAALVESALELADAGKFVLDDERRAELEANLAQLDRKNAALRTARQRTSELARTGLALIADYRTAGRTLRASTLAADLAAVLGEPLRPIAAELREESRAQGLLQGSIRGFTAQRDAWESLLAVPLERFDVGAESTLLGAVRANAMIDTTFEVRGEYVVSATLHPEGPREPGSSIGLLVAGAQERPTTIVGIDDRGNVGLWTLSGGKKGSSTVRKTRTIGITPRVAEGEAVDLSVRVRHDGGLEIQVGGRPRVDAVLEAAPNGARHAGLFAKNASVRFEDPRVELLP